MLNGAAWTFKISACWVFFFPYIAYRAKCPIIFIIQKQDAFAFFTNSIKFDPIEFITIYFDDITFFIDKYLFHVSLILLYL